MTDDNIKLSKNWRKFASKSLPINEADDKKMVEQIIKTHKEACSNDSTGEYCCKTCIENAIQAGFDKGYKEGVEDGALGVAKPIAKLAKGLRKSLE